MAIGIARRQFMSALGSATIAWPVAVRAQQQDRTYRIGWLQPNPIAASWLTAFKQGMASLNYVEGKNLIVDYRWGHGDLDQLPGMAAELVSLNPDVIVSTNTAVLLALQKLTRSIPIVMQGLSDPLAVGLIGSLARPGGNITGLSQMVPELSGKRLELLKEAVPNLARVMVLSNPGNPAVVLGLQQTRTAAQTLSLSVDSVDVRTPLELDRAFSIIVDRHPDGLLLLADTMIVTERFHIAEFTTKNRLPAISPYRESTEAGELMTYGVSMSDIIRRSAGYIDQILKGKKPAELPVEQPVKFDLIINLKTAKTLGLDVSPHLLAQADEVIE
jgi:putative ABC transport system substrate-binding protein